MATKVKPIRLNITWTPQVGNVPTYVDANTFAWWAWWGWGASFGRFLSLWNCTTWQPISFPEATPYNYLTWDYFIVETVSSATPPVNYRPDWSSYTGTASSVTESDEVEVWDTYVYDGTTWLLQSNHGKTVTFANIAWDPYDNANLDTALDAKQDVLVSWTNIKTVNSNSLLWSGNVSVWDVKYADYNWTTLTWNNVTLALNSQITPTANFTINAPWTIKDWQEYILRVTSGWTVYAITLGTNISNPNNVDTTLTANSIDQFVFLAVWWQLELQKELQEPIVYTAWTWIDINASNVISNTSNIKVFYLASTSDLTNAQAAHDWQNWWSTALIIYNNKPYTYLWGNAASMNFKCLYPYEKSSNQTWKTELVQDALIFSLSSWTVTSISANSRYNTISAYLNTDQNYTTPYTPTYDWSPATKKYVDDWLATKQDELVSWVNIRTINWTSVLWNWDIATPTWIPSQTWEAGKFLTTDWTSVSWWTVQSWWIQNDTTWTTTTVTKIRAWTEAEYNALQSHDASTIYHIY